MPCQIKMHEEVGPNSAQLICRPCSNQLIIEANNDASHSCCPNLTADRTTSQVLPGPPLGAGRRAKHSAHLRS